MKIGKGTCSCKAFEEYNGFCKHLVAVLLEADYYVDEYTMTDFLEEQNVGDCDVLFEEGDMVDDWDFFPEDLYGEDEDFSSYDSRQKTLDDFLGDFLTEEIVKKGMPSSASVTGSGRTFSYSSKPVMRESSKELLDAISGVVLQERNQFCQEIAGGDVAIEVTLRLEPESESIELRIGKKQMYVVKNIEELVDNIRRQKYVKYGKNLEFVHTQSAFTKDALGVVSLLLNAPFNASSRQNYYYYSTASQKRSLELDTRMLEELLLLYAGKSLLVESCLTYDKYETPVKQENPYLPVYISERNHGKEAEIVFPEILLLEGTKGFSI